MTEKELQKLRRDIMRNHLTWWMKRLIAFVEENDLPIQIYVYGKYIRFADLDSELIITNKSVLNEDYWSLTDNKFMTEKEIKERLKLMFYGLYYRD